MEVLVCLGPTKVYIKSSELNSCVEVVPIPADYSNHWLHRHQAVMDLNIILNQYQRQIQKMICEKVFLYIFMVFIAGDVFCIERLFGKRFMTHDLWVVQLIDFYILRQRTWPSMYLFIFRVCTDYTALWWLKLETVHPLALFQESWTKTIWTKTDNTASPNIIYGYLLEWIILNLIFFKSRLKKSNFVAHSRYVL